MAAKSSPRRLFVSKLRLPLRRSLPGVIVGGLGGIIAGILVCLPAMANPIPADELSLLNGAEHFERFCTECHGWDPSAQHTELYSPFPDDESEPIVVVPPVDAEEPPEPGVFDTPEIDDWPDWAGPPPQEQASEDEDEALRSDLLEELNAAIDAAYAQDVSPRELSDEYADDYYAADISDELDARYLVMQQEAQERRVVGATDLTDPDSYIYGTTDTELFRHIAHGTGPTMPGFLSQLGSENAVWDLINYIRSLWGEDWVD